jgi:hypothetical protein
VKCRKVDFDEPETLQDVKRKNFVGELPVLRESLSGFHVFFTSVRQSLLDGYLSRSQFHLHLQTIKELVATPTQQQKVKRITWSFEDFSGYRKRQGVYPYWHRNHAKAYRKQHKHLSRCLIYLYFK